VAIRLSRRDTEAPDIGSAAAAAAVYVLPKCSYR